MRRQQLWSDEETEILRELWPNPKVSKEDIRKVFSSRSWTSITHKAYECDELKNFTSYRNAEINLEYYKKLMSKVKG